MSPRLPAVFVALAVVLVTASPAEAGHGDRRVAAFSTAVAPSSGELAAMEALRDRLDRLIEALPEDEAACEALALAAARLLPELHRARLQPDGDPDAFTVWLPEGGLRPGSAGNPALRRDLLNLAADVERLAELDPETGGPETDGPASRALVASQRGLVTLTARYRAYIAARWSLSPATQAIFEQVRDRMAEALLDPALADQVAEADWDTLAGLSRRPSRPSRPSRHEEARPTATPPAPRPNPFLAKVDAAISDPAARAAIRRAQPAAVHLGNGSGVNVAAHGLVLTNAHVVKALGTRHTVTFPDGQVFAGVATAYDAHLDLALVTLEGAPRSLPFARLAARAPTVGTWVAVIGQPGRFTPEGELTGYQRFHVSTGRIRSLRSDVLGPQRLGAVGHDAWTYWGHSGSPLFSASGELVALHNSWDASTAMRHAIPWQAITRFLGREGGL
jgi:S1-C subfamily serine protease